MPSIARARAASPQPPKLNLHLFSPAARPPSSLTDRIAYRPETKSGSHTTLRWRGVDSNFRFRVGSATISRPCPRPGPAPAERGGVVEHLLAVGRGTDLRGNSPRRRLTAE